MTRRTVLPAAVALALSGARAAESPARGYTPGEPVGGTFEQRALPFLEAHCFECHDDEVAKGDLSLVDLGPVDETNASRWKSIWAQVALREMPPKKKIAAAGGRAAPLQATGSSPRCRRP